jgi:hypothetical protein
MTNKTTNKFSPEVRERAALEREGDYPKSGCGMKWMQM